MNTLHDLTSARRPATDGFCSVSWAGRKHETGGSVRLHEQLSLRMPKALCSHLSQSKLLAALNVSIKKCAEHREVISVHPFSWVALLVLQEEDWFWLWRDKDVSILNLQRSHLSIVSPAERNNRQWAENQTSLSRWKLRDVGRDSEAGTTRGSSQGTEMIRRLKCFSNKVMIEPGMSLISP